MTAYKTPVKTGLGLQNITGQILVFHQLTEMMVNGLTGGYGGEASGIKTSVTKSRRF